MKLSEIKPSDKNPRQIKKEKLELLKKSVSEFEKMMYLRPIVVDESGTILGGNMRYRALKALGRTEIPDEWVTRAQDLTEQEKRRFVIEDNAGFGEWDWDVLANEWDDCPLADWGVDVPKFIEGGDEEIKDIEIKASFRIEIVCKDEEEQEKLYNKFIEEGLECRLLTL